MQIINIYQKKKNRKASKISIYIRGFPSLVWIFLLFENTPKPYV